MYSGWFENLKTNVQYLKLFFKFLAISPDFSFSETHYTILGSELFDIDVYTVGAMVWIMYLKGQ